jgi:hypothetical protein
MALYIPPARRRRRLIVAASAALLVGLLGGVLIGRSTAPTIDDRVAAVQSDARAAAAGLRVIALHDEAGALSNQEPGGGGADLTLRQTRTALQQAFDHAPWLGGRQRAKLLSDLDKLSAITNKTSKQFGAAADALATEIETTFAHPDRPS